jgi:prepilin-type N-terminal cleavage/methylation domain-containing protein
MRRNLKPTEFREAFTLVEVLVVVVLAAIAAALIVPYASTSDTQAVSAARIVVSDLQYAQSQAITTQLTTTVSFDTNTRTYTLSNQSGTLNNPMTGKPYVVSFSAARGFEDVSSLSATFGAGHSVAFDSTGAPTPAGSVTVQAGRSKFRLDVADATGNVTVTRVGS